MAKSDLDKMTSKLTGGADQAQEAQPAPAQAAKPNPAPAVQPSAVVEMPKPRKVAPVLANRAYGSEGLFLWPHFQVAAEAGTTKERIMETDYWSNIKTLAVNSTIQIMPDSGEWTAKLTVVQVFHGGAKVVLDSMHDLPNTKITTSLSPDYRVEWSGPLTKFRVVRIRDGETLKDMLETEELGRRWIVDYQRTLAA